MAQPQNPRPAVPTEAVVAALASTQGGSSNPRLDALLDMLAEEAALKRKARLEEEETQRNMRLQNARAMEEKHQRDVAFQSQCTHMITPDRAAIAGQKAHNGKYQLLCSKCSKLWHDVSELPLGLHDRIKWEWIGGPQ